MAERIQIQYLQEEDFCRQMKQTVEPYLKRYRTCARFKSFDGTKIFYYAYVRKYARGSIVISHGFSEFADKYNEMVYYFLQAGYSVFLPEHRGHGRSERSVRNISKVHVKSFEQYVWDLHIFVKRIVMPYNNERILFAHSMGGAIGALYMMRYPRDFKKAVLSSPMIQMKVGGMPYKTAIAFARVCCMCGLGRLFAARQHSFDGRPHFEQSSCLSKERYMYTFAMRMQRRAFKSSGASYRWVTAAAKASEYMQEAAHIRRIKIPVLVFAAGREHMVSTDEICRFAGKLTNARLVWMLHAKHEIFNAEECDRIHFYDEIFAFLCPGTF